MSARLLAYGGTGFSERRRIGQWPAVPEATLRDVYGLQGELWSFGFGVLAKQPFLIFRQRQNIENRGGYPFSLLLDPGEAVWERYAWNAASLAAALLRENPDLLFRTPEICSADALENLVSGGSVQSTSGESDSALSLVFLGALRAPDPVAVPSASLSLAERPDPATVASALAALPVCFRAGGGWLVGGGGAHGRALGACLVVDDRSAADPAPWIESARKLAGAWNSAAQRGLLEAYENKPMWQWDEDPAGVLDAVLLLRDLETAQSPADELLARAASSNVLQAPIEQASANLLTRGALPIGRVASALLIGYALKGKRKIESKVAERLDPETVRAELRKQGIPPKRIPKTLPVSRDLRTGLWVAYLEGLQSDVRKSLADAIEQCPEERETLVSSALAALPASEEKLLDWARFRDDEETWTLLEAPLQEEALRRFRRNVRGAAEAYLAFGGTPAAVQPDAPPAREKRPNREETDKSKARELRQALQTLLFESGRGAVEEESGRLRAKFEKVNSPQMRAELDDMIEEGCASSCDRFATAFFKQYTALGDVMLFLSDRAQDRLIACLAESKSANLSEFAARDISHAINNRFSRSGYTRALSRLLVRDRALRRHIADELGELPGDLEVKLTQMLSKKDGRA